jgi:hypothetical protein
MILRKVLLFLLVSLCLWSFDPAQEVTSHDSVPKWDFGNTVVTISALKLHGLGIAENEGTGFCLDSSCRFVGTNYHVAVLANTHRIKGERVVQRYLATGPDDEDATVNEGPEIGPMKYTLSRDLAIFELGHPLRRHHGAAFSLKDLQIGQEVEIYAYPKEGLSRKRKLIRVSGTFKAETTEGLLAFDYDSVAKEIRPGVSGGIVVDSRTQQIVGVLNSIERNGEPVAMAVPIQSLADFVSKVDPSLAMVLFPIVKVIPPDSPDLYPKLTLAHFDSLQHRVEEPDEVKLLRTKAQLLANSMRDFIAVQTFAWGREEHQPSYASAYEVRVIDGDQRFREYPDGRKELEDAPLPPLNTAISTGGEWSDLPLMVGRDMGLEIHQAPDTIVDNRRIKVFQYVADLEDRACQFKTIADFLLFRISSIATVGCYGEVWTDEDINILRMSEHLELLGKWKNYQGVVTYGWFHQKDEAPHLIPLTISTQAEYKKKIYWCRGRFTNYQRFTTRAEVKAAAK